MALIRKFVTGPIETNTFLITDPACQALVVDPSRGQKELLRIVSQERLTVAAVLLTHCHFDHFLGLSEILAVFPEAEVWASPEAHILLSNANYNGSVMLGQELTYTGPLSVLPEGPVTVAGYSLEILYIPGHSPCGICIRIDNDCITGDVLFAGAIGRTDFAYGNTELLLSGIRAKLLPLPDETVVWPGHGGRTTIGREKRLNPFLSS